MTVDWSAERIARGDAAHVWHPYSPRHAAQPQLPVRSARGVYLTLADGRRVIDGMSSWWAVCHGHSHPHLVEAAQRQCERMSHVMFGGLTHQPAVELAERLLALVNTVDARDLRVDELRTGDSPARGEAAARRSPASTSLRGEPLTSVFYSDSGSVAVEVALKMALQYQRGVGRPERDRILTWRGGYYGDTQGPMGICDPDGGMHSLWAGTLTPQVFVPVPPRRSEPGWGDADGRPRHPQLPREAPRGESPAGQADPAAGLGEQEHGRYLAALAEHIERANGTDHGIAAVVVEPVVQGAGGMRFHDHELVAGLREVCDRTGTLLVFDEIATGFGRTGTAFASTASGVRPDILCLGKALTGGFLSFAATLATDAVARAVEAPEAGGALMHGPTFMGNPLACAVALAACDLHEQGYWREATRAHEAQMRAALEPLRGSEAVADVRVLGGIGVVEMAEPVDVPRATDVVVERGVWLRPFGRLLYSMPPFVATSAQVAEVTEAMAAVVRDAESRAPEAAAATGTGRRPLGAAGVRA